MDFMKKFRIGSGLQNFLIRTRWLCGHFLSKAWVNYDWIYDCIRGLNRSRILKFKKLPSPD